MKTVAALTFALLFFVSGTASAENGWYFYRCDCRTSENKVVGQADFMAGLLDLDSDVFRMIAEQSCINAYINEGGHSPSNCKKFNKDPKKNPDLDQAAE